MVSLVSWNVNGIRSAMKKGLKEFIEAEKPSILCLQEVKAEADQVALDLPAGYHQFWNPATSKKGYSGTAIFSKFKPLTTTLELRGQDCNNEGRVITLEFSGVFLVNVYTPNAKRELTRLDFRVGVWDKAFRKYVQELAKIKPVIFCGDLNVAHTEIDIANPKSNMKNSGFTPQERASFTELLDAGFVDSFRHFVKEGGHYSWWSPRPGVRERNIGWRIDYICVSPELMPHLQTSEILKDVHGSDHCPVRAVFSEKVFKVNA